MDNDFMIRVGAGIALFGGLAVALGIWTFRHYSAKKASVRHIEIQSGIKKFDSTFSKGIENINSEFKNTITEIQNQKKNLSSKIEEETDFVIKELKSKSINANKALDELKKQSDNASNVIASQVNTLKDVTVEGLTKLSYPFPSELIPINLSVTIDSNGFKKFIPELHKKYKIKDNSKLNKYRNKRYYSTSGLSYGIVSDEIMRIFDGKTIDINVSSDDRDTSIEANNPRFGWSFRVNTSIKDNNNHRLSFRIDYGQRTSDKLVLNLQNLNKLDQSGTLRIFGGLSSALELCGKRVRISIGIDGTGVKAPVYSIDELTFMDNNSKEYRIRVVEFRNRKIKIPAIQEDNINLPERSFEITEIVGEIECLSF